MNILNVRDHGLETNLDIRFWARSRQLLLFPFAHVRKHLVLSAIALRACSKEEEAQQSFKVECKGTRSGICCFALWL